MQYRKKSSEQLVEFAENEKRYTFTELDQESIRKMKEEFYSEQPDENLKALLRSMSSQMASVLDKAGFNHAAEFLNYSLLPMREEPKVYGSGSVISGDIWTYSTEFQTVIKQFLNRAKSLGSYEYFATTSMEFAMPSASKIDILTNTSLKKWTDLFGALKKVDVNLGLVKTNGAWDIIVQIQDVYDFANEQYNGLVDLVNNIAYYEQERGKVNPYKIIINASQARLYTLPFGVGNW